MVLAILLPGRLLDCGFDKYAPHGLINFVHASRSRGGASRHGCCWCFLLVDLEAAQPLQQALDLLLAVADGRRLGAQTVELRLHGGDEGLAGLVGAVLVDEVVEVVEEVADVFDFLRSL